MSLLFGTTISSKPQYTGLQLQTAAASSALPVCWGRNRIAPNLMWYGDFKTIKKTQKQGKGGVTTETYEYKVSAMFGLCEGTISGVDRAWKDQSVEDFADTALSIFYGTVPQAPWGYLVTAHPTEALNYAGVAYLAGSDIDLGASAYLGQRSYEVRARHYGTAPNGRDADCSIVVDEFLTNEAFGATFPASGVDYDQLFSTPAAPTTGDNSYQTYCKAMNFGFSPCLNGATPSLEILNRWARLTNTAVVWNGDKLKMMPYGDAVVTANGVTYLPNNTVRATLNDEDFVGDAEEDPIMITRSDPAEAYNTFRMEIRDWEFEYNSTPVEWKDQNLIEQFGVRQADTIRADEITDKTMGAVMVGLMGQRLAYIRNEYSFRLSPSFIMLEPMDLVIVQDPALGTLTLRIRTVEEDDDGVLTFTAEQYLSGVSSPPAVSTQPSQGGSQNTVTPPGPVNPPIIFEPPTSLSNGENQVWAAVSGGDGANAGQYWGGCNVFVSTDNITYNQIGVVENPATMGKLTATLASFAGPNPSTQTLKVTTAMSAEQLFSITATEAANYGNLCYVDGEYVSFEDATLTGVFAYDITNMYRGLFGSTASSHASGSNFAMLDNDIFKYRLVAGYVGVTLYFKFQSFNVWGNATQDLSTCAVYTYTPTGGGVPATPTSFSATGGYQQNNLSWVASSTASVSSYKIYAYLGTTTNFALASLIGTVSGSVTSYTHSGLALGATYTYWVVATSIGGDSAPAGPQTATTVAAPIQPYGFSFQKGAANITASQPFAFFDTPVAWTLPAGMTGSQATIGGQGATAPSSQTDFDVQSPPGTSIGTIRFAASSLTATFIKAASSSIPLGQVTQIVAPSTLNGMAGTLFGSIIGTR